MAIPAPRCKTNDRSDAMHNIDNIGGALSADLNLRSISGKPKWGPQKTSLWVDATPAAVVLIDEDNVTYTITVSTVPLVITRPMKTLVDSGSGDVNVCFEWFDPQGSTEWNK